MSENKDNATPEKSRNLQHVEAIQDALDKGEPIVAILKGAKYMEANFADGDQLCGFCNRAKIHATETAKLVNGYEGVTIVDEATAQAVNAYQKVLSQAEAIKRELIAKGVNVK